MKRKLCSVLIFSLGFSTAFVVVKYTTPWFDGHDQQTPPLRAPTATLTNEELLGVLVNYEAKLAELLEEARDHLLAGDGDFSVKSVVFIQERSEGKSYFLDGDVQGLLSVEKNSPESLTLVFRPGRGDWGCSALRVVIDK